MASKQFEHLQESSLRRLQALVPAACYLIVTRSEHGGFKVQTIDDRDFCIGRYQLVATWIEGYVAAWKRVARPQPSTPESVAADVQAVRRAVDSLVRR